jgi:hypothetical protein
MIPVCDEFAEKTADLNTGISCVLPLCQIRHAKINDANASFFRRPRLRYNKQSNNQLEKYGGDQSCERT